MKKSLFYKIYFSCIAVFLVALSVGLIYFGSLLKAFEAGQPEHIIQNITSLLSKNNAISVLAEEYDIAVSKYENEATLKKFYDENIKDKKIVFTTLPNVPDGADLAYGIFADNTQILTVLLTNEDNIYSVKKVSLNKTFYKTFTITAAQDVEITVNDKKVTDSERKSAQLPEIAEKYIGKKPATLKQVITLNNMLYAPLSVKAASSGKQASLQNVNNTYSAEQNFAERLKITDIAEKGASTYSLYMYNDSSLQELARYIDTSSEFYKNVSSTDVHYTLKHTKGVIEDLSITDIHKYNDNLYSCHVELTNVMYKKKLVHKDYFKKDVFVARTGNSYKIIDMQNPIK